MIAITGHFERPKVKRLAEKAEKLLHDLGVECTAADIRKKEFNSQKVETVIAVGGDGTLLRVVRELKKEKPVLGVAAGRHSFLMNVKEKSLEKALKKVALGKCRVEERMRLQAVADGKKMPPALNEAMVVNRESAALARFLLKVNGRKKGLIEADGLIIATPTGSTGHAYSAGGKRLGIGGKKLAVVPSNPLHRKAKPFYVKSGSKIVVEGFDKGEEFEAIVDGRVRKVVKKRLSVGRGRHALIIKT